jgi:hypothetical protein
LLLQLIIFFRPFCRCCCCIMNLPQFLFNWCAKKPKLLTIRSKTQLIDHCKPEL